MGKDVIIRGETYNGVGKVNLLTANGSANFYDVSGALCTITAEYDEVEEYDEVYTSDKTAQEVYDALEVGINPVFRFHDLRDNADAYIYASLTKLESTEDGEELTLSSFQTDAMIADTLSDYFTLTVHGEPPSVEKTVTGAVVTVTDALAEPAVDLVVTIAPVQSGTGTPSPANVRPISGWTGANIYVCGINLWDGTWENGNISDSTGRNSGTSSSYFRSAGYIPLKGGQSYYPYSSHRKSNYRQFYYDKDKNFLGYTGTAWGSVKNTATLEYADKICFMRFRVSGAHEERDSTTSFNIPSTDTTTHVYDGTTYTVSFGTAGTVYGGTLDVTAGTLTVTHGQIASYAGETLPGAWISDRDAYAVGTTPTTGAQVVYELATPTTVTLTPTEITLLLGTNNVWSDTGDTTLTYLADGRVNSLTALNMLLGGAYTPSADVSDREALQIIMGETE